MESNDKKQAKAKQNDEKSKIKQLEEKLAALETELVTKNDEICKLNDGAAEQNDKYLRLAAEYDNYRKRAVREKEMCYTDAYADAVGAFLPVVDNAERAAEYAVDDTKLSEGVLMLKKQLDDVLAKIGVSVIAPDGEEFDPQLHNAVMHEEDDSEKVNIVTETLQKGYSIKGKVVRHAMVKVIN